MVSGQTLGLPSLIEDGGNSRLRTAEIRTSHLNGRSGDPLWRRFDSLFKSSSTISLPDVLRKIVLGIICMNALRRIFIAYFT